MSTLWTLLRRYGCPETFVKIIQKSMMDPFEISHELKQGCVFAPTLFTLFLAALLSTVSEHLSTAVFIRTRSDGTLFQLARLIASTTLENSAFVKYYLQMMLLSFPIHEKTPEIYASSLNKLQPCFNFKSIQRKL